MSRHRWLLMCTECGQLRVASDSPTCCTGCDAADFRPVALAADQPRLVLHPDSPGSVPLTDGDSSSDCRGQVTENQAKSSSQ